MITNPILMQVLQGAMQPQGYVGTPGIVPNDPGMMGGMGSSPFAGNMAEMTKQPQKPDFGQKLNSALQNPMTQFGLNLLANSGPSTQPRGFGQILGQAGLQTMQTQQRQSMNDLQRRLFESQIGLSEARAQQAMEPDSANTNVQSTFRGQNGNMFIVTRNGEVKDTGVQFSESLRTITRPDGSVVLVDDTRGAADEPRVVVSPEEAVEGASTRVGAETEARETAQVDVQSRQEARKELDRISEAESANREMLDRLKRGDFQTGPVIGQFPAVQTPGQEFDVFSGQGVIDAIGQATFGALSEGEREFLTTTVPSRDKTEEANIRIIERRLRILERARKRAEAKIQPDAGFEIVD